MGRDLLLGFGSLAAFSVPRPVLVFVSHGADAPLDDPLTFHFRAALIYGKRLFTHTHQTKAPSSCSQSTSLAAIRRTHRLQLVTDVPQVSRSPR